jgi:hypothetical protein
MMENMTREELVREILRARAVHKIPRWGGGGTDETALCGFKLPPRKTPRKAASPSASVTCPECLSLLRLVETAKLADGARTRIRAKPRSPAAIKKFVHKIPGWKKEGTATAVPAPLCGIRRDPRITLRRSTRDRKVTCPECRALMGENPNI